MQALKTVQGKIGGGKLFVVHTRKPSLDVKKFNKEGLPVCTGLVELVDIERVLISFLSQNEGLLFSCFCSLMPNQLYIWHWCFAKYYLFTNVNKSTSAKFKMATM
jgi:hypothetical protein